jgi:cytochrome c553
MKRLLLLALVPSAVLMREPASAGPGPLGSHAQAPPPATAAPAGNADEGKKLYVSVGCYQCHGYEAQGSSATGPRLGPRPMAYAAFSRYVRRPSGQMPPYTAKVVSDADLANIYAFIRSRPEPGKEIPLLKP